MREFFMVNFPILDHINPFTAQYTFLCFVPISSVRRFSLILGIIGIPILGHTSTSG